MRGVTVWDSDGAGYVGPANCPQCNVTLLVSTLRGGVVECPYRCGWPGLRIIATTPKRGRPPIANPAKVSQRTRVSESEAAALTEAAEAAGLTRSAWIRRAIQRAL